MDYKSHQTALILPQFKLETMSTNNHQHHLHIVSAKTWGGGESYVFNLAKHAIANGDSITIITDSRYPQIAQRFSDITQPIEIPLSFGLTIPNILKIHRILKSSQISTINYHSGKVALLSVLVSILSKVPCVFFKHNISLGKNDFYHNFLMRHLAGVICVSNTVKDAVIRGIPKMYAPKVHLVYTGISLPENTQKNEASNRIRIGYAGRIVQNKGVEVLLQACQQLSEDVDLFVAGNCNSVYGKELQSKYAEPHIHFIGEQTDLSHFYQSIEIFVAPSIVPEAFGLAICEAMSYGLPVITTTSGAQSELIQNGVDGLLICPNNVEELIENLQKLAQDKNLRNSMGQNAKERVESTFTMDHFYSNLTKFYRSL